MLPPSSLIGEVALAVNNKFRYPYGMKTAVLTERLELRLSPEHMERLRRIRKLTEIASDAEVVRQALKEYESLLNKRKS